MTNTRTLSQMQKLSIYATVLLLCKVPQPEIAIHVALFARQCNIKNISKIELNEALNRVLQIEATKNISQLGAMRK